MKWLTLICLMSTTLQAQNACFEPKPIFKPMPSLGCQDMQPACSCNGQNCKWVWVCATASNPQRSDLDLFLEAQRNGQKASTLKRGRKATRQEDREYSTQELDAWAKSLRTEQPNTDSSQESDAMIRQLIQMKTQSALDGMEGIKAAVKALQEGAVTNALPSPDLFESGLYKLTPTEISKLNESLLTLMRTIVSESGKPKEKP